MAGRGSSHKGGDKVTSSLQDRFIPLSVFWRRSHVSVSRITLAPIRGPGCKKPVKKEAPGQHRGIADAEGWGETQQAAAELQEASVRELGQL